MIDVLTTEVERRLEAVVLDRLRDEPVLLLQGPRAVGKSVLLDRLARRFGVTVTDLDNLETRAAVRADPAIFVEGPSPILIDEYQHAIELLDAMKAELNQELRPGRFVMTGSTSYSSLPRVAQSLAGRLSRIDVWPLSQGERDGVYETFVADLLTAPESLLRAKRSTTPRVEYIARTVAGGYPLALMRDEAARGRWLDEYVDIVVERDVVAISRIRQRHELPTLLACLAAQTAQMLNVSAVALASGLSPDSAERYTALLESVFMIHRLPAWGRTLRRRVVGKPKVHMRDSGLAARLLKLTPEKLARKTPTALTEFGHLFETFIVNEILKQASWVDQSPTAGHWRTHAGEEVDLVLEASDGGVFGVEITTGTRVSASDLTALQQLRDDVGDDFVAGVFLSTGERSYTADDRIHVLPADRLWTTRTAPVAGT